ncbi:hypothetical protein GCM10009541_57120 [Micromonospora gifhornensis]|uniref:Calcineurin-like phosphoesterase domain-containing protein n=1 Tax=Micromonospora gifhornensis TaxID=84594 RepID=A0ABQ4IJ42_9ACTN|nr:hypothetical protein [Micromonospora gifhornensis]GIJ17920.1 hypothetical protein Vgi01_46040 [Micromonospora gifhornensis]
MDLMIVAGVHLDRAWSQLGGPYGVTLRQWSREVLARVVDEAHRRNVGTLVIAGDLLDRATAVPATVDYAAKVLGAFRGDILIAPGRSDWIGGPGPYGFQDWSPNTYIWSAAEYEPSPTVPLVWASAWTSPVGYSPRVPDAAGPRMLVRAEMGEADLHRLSTRHDDLHVTTGTVMTEKILTIPDLVHDPRAAGGYALIVDGDDPNRPAERVDLPAQPGRLVEIDVTRLQTTDALAASIDSALKAEGPLLLRLTGTLAPPVLLPGFGGPELPPGVVVDLDPLIYGRTTPDSSDRGARAEFLRAMADIRTNELERHQSTALGLAALDANTQGA